MDLVLDGDTLITAMVTDHGVGEVITILGMVVDIMVIDLTIQGIIILGMEEVITAQVMVMEVIIDRFLMEVQEVFMEVEEMDHLDTIQL